MRHALHVRDARGDDWRTMEWIFRDAGKAAWSDILAEDSLAALNPPDRWYRAIFSKDPRVHVFSVEAEAQVIGFVAIRPSEDEGALPLTVEIDGFYTDPKFWGRGAGQLLMARALEAAKEARYLRATLWTEERNTRPRRFYELNGWRLDGGVRERTVHGSALRELRYFREL